MTNGLTEPAACAVLGNDLRLKVLGEGNGLVRLVVARHVALAALDTCLLIDPCPHLLLARELRMVHDTAEGRPDKVLDRQQDHLFAARRDVIQLAAALVRYVTTNDLIPLLFRPLPLDVAVCLVPCPSKRLTRANCSVNSASVRWNRRDPCGRGEP